MYECQTTLIVTTMFVWSIQNFFARVHLVHVKRATWLVSRWSCDFTAYKKANAYCPCNISLGHLFSLIILRCLIGQRKKNKKSEFDEIYLNEIALVFQATLLVNIRFNKYFSGSYKSCKDKLHHWVFPWRIQNSWPPLTDALTHLCDLQQVL